MGNYYSLLLTSCDCRAIEISRSSLKPVIHWETSLARGLISCGCLTPGSENVIFKQKFTCPMRWLLVFSCLLSYDQGSGAVLSACFCDRLSLNLNYELDWFCNDEARIPLNSFWILTLPYPFWWRLKSREVLKGAPLLPAVAPQGNTLCHVNTRGRKLSYSVEQYVIQMKADHSTSVCMQLYKHTSPLPPVGDKGVCPRRWNGPAARQGSDQSS